MIEAKIKFKTLKWKNFFSYGNYFTEIQLDTNEIIMLSGDNGSGKSVILDAFYFCLTGSPLRDTNKPNLVNSINKKNCVVELEFYIKNKKYKIIRGIHPNIFQIYENDELIPEDGKQISFYQKKLNDITELTPEIIKNILVVNSSLKSFFKLSKYEKRKFIDDIFKLSIFNLMLEKQKEKNIENIQKRDKSNNKLSLLESTLKHQHTQLKQYNDIVKTIKSNKISQKEKIQNKINKLIEKTKTIEIKLKSKEEKLKKIIEKNNIETNKENDYNSLLSKENMFKLEITELPEIKEICDRCGQNLPIKKIIELKEKNINKKTELEKSIKEIVKEKKKIKFKSKIDTKELENIIDNFKKQIHSNALLKNELKDNLKTFEEKLPEKPSININETKQQILEIKKKIKKYKKIIEYLKITNKILLDGDLKAFMISNYVPFINEQFNYFLELFNFDIKIKFASDLEWEIVSAKYKNYNYDNFSTGEKMRINLSLLFTFINLSKLINFGSMNQLYNILFLDEFLDSGMDNNGMEDCLQLLVDKNKNENISIFIVSHKFSAENTDFINYEAVKNGHFSRLNKK